MRILVACEESQAITIELRKLGHIAFSCDLLPCSGGHPEWHIQGDVIEQLDKGWDMMIAHPPCTFLAGSGVAWLSHPEDRDLPFEDRRPHPLYPNRKQDMLDSIEFIKKLYDSPIPQVAIENPVGLLSTRWRKPDQIIQPYMFGDKATKTTCLWMKNLPPLLPTEIVSKGERFEWVDGKTGKTKSQPMWYYEALKNAKTKQERQSLRSKTFPGIAKAIAKQWAGEVSNIF